MNIIDKKNDNYGLELNLLFPKFSSEKNTLFGIKRFSLEANTTLELWGKDFSDFVYFKIQILGFGFSFNMECYE